MKAEEERLAREKAERDEKEKAERLAREKAERDEQRPPLRGPWDEKDKQERLAEQTSKNLSYLVSELWYKNKIKVLAMVVLSVLVIIAFLVIYPGPPPPTNTEKHEISQSTHAGTAGEPNTSSGKSPAAQTVSTAGELNTGGEKSPAAQALSHFERALKLQNAGNLNAAIAAYREALLSCLSWNWRGRSSVKITERTHEKRTKALHRRREGCHPEAALVG